MYSKQPSLSQNFLINRELVNQLVRDSSITPTDYVLEIGPGTGHLTATLLASGCRILAIEKDLHLFHGLRSRYSNCKRLQLIHHDFLQVKLPKEPYKVFSNLPFSITGDAIRRLLLADNPPSEAWLVVQSEAAEKLLVTGTSHNLLAILVYPWFEIKNIHTFEPHDFHPRPGVDTCLMHIKYRPIPLVPLSVQAIYRDFVVHTFNHNPLAKYINASVWLGVFQKSALKTAGSYQNWLHNHSRLHKIHRTRTDPHWKSFSQ